MNKNWQKATNNYISLIEEIFRELTGIAHPADYVSIRERLGEESRALIEELKKSSNYIYTVTADYDMSPESYFIFIGSYDDENIAIEQKEKYEQYIKDIKEYYSEWYHSIDVAMNSNTDLNIFSDFILEKYYKIYYEKLMASRFNFCKIEKVEINKTLDYKDTAIELIIEGK